MTLGRGAFKTMVIMAMATMLNAMLQKPLGGSLVFFPVSASWCFMIKPSAAKAEAMMVVSMELSNEAQGKGKGNDGRNDGREHGGNDGRGSNEAQGKGKGPWDAKVLLDRIGATAAHHHDQQWHHQRRHCGKGNPPTAGVEFFAHSHGAA